MDRALRRHRKRLAKIVVDHWLFKARTRLFVLRLQKVFQKHWKKLCFKTLKEFAISNALKHEKQETARSFTKTLRKKQCFYAWVTFYKLESERRDAVFKLATLVRRRICTEFICLWHRQNQKHIDNQRKLLMAERFWSLSLLSTYFMYWQLGLQILQRKHHLKRLALGFWAHKKLSMSLLALKRAVGLRNTTMILTTKRNRRLMESLFKHWHSITIEDVKQLHRQACCASNKSLLLRSFRNLQEYASKKNSSKRVNHIASCFHHDQCMYCTYKAWHDYAVFRHDKTRLKAAAVAHLERKIMRSALIKWHLYTQSKRHQEQNEGLCRLSHVAALLQSQNRLLRRGFHQIIRKERLSAKRGIKTLLISRACILYRRCIQELASAARIYIKSSKEKRCHVCAEHVSCNEENVSRVAVLPIQQVLASPCDVAVEELCPNKDRSSLAHWEDPAMLPTAEKESSTLLEAIAALPNSRIEMKAPLEKFSRLKETRTVLESCRGRLSRRTRLPPRRPLYLSESFALERRVSDPKLIREELLWTEDLLGSFDKLKEKLQQKEAELVALHGRHNSGDKLQVEKVRFLEEKIMILQERQSILLPMVEGLANRANVLQRSFKGSQILHLD